MSSIVNKVKDALSSHSHDNDPTTGSTNAGPHNTNLGNKADPRVDSDLDGRAGTGNYSGSTNAGPHDSNLANKLDPRVDSDRDGSKTVGQSTSTGYSNTGSSGFSSTGTGSTNAGPHDSNLLNKADPRVDSDRDGSRNLGAATGSTGASAYSGTGTGTTGYSNTGSGFSSTGTGSTNAGPHNSNLLNKADPRVDSDLDGSRNLGASTGATGASAYGNTGYSGTGVSHGTTGLTGTGSTNAGPHDSNLLNKADPRVDSDRDGSRNFGAATGATGASAYDSTTTGTHTGAHHGQHSHHGHHGHHGHHAVEQTGPAPNTAGPHSSDLLNKADPRVDSNLDGSKTIGGNATYNA